MSSSPSPPPTSSTIDSDGRDVVSYGNGADKSSQTTSSSLTLFDAMEAADNIRKAYRNRSDPKETGQMVPPGTWQGVAAFAATGLLMTPFRRSILQMTGPRGPFQGFVDLVVTPILAISAAQAGLVIGTLYGSSYYLDRLALDAATTTTSSLNNGSNEVMSVRIDRDDKISYSPTTESLAIERDISVTKLCKELLSVSSPPPSPPTSEPHIHSSTSHTTTTLQTETPSFASWDPRSKTMKSLLDAVEMCRRREY